MWDKIRRFLFASVHEVVTWVWIGLSIGAYFHNAGNKNERGVRLAGISLAASVFAMLCFIAKRIFWDSDAPPLLPRPNLAVKGAQTRFRVDGVEDIVVVITNLGELAAKDLWLDGFTSVKHKDFKGPLEREGSLRTDSPTDIIPGDTISVTLRGSGGGGRAWSREGINGVLNGKYLLFHYSEGEYGDGRGNVYPISFCFRYEPGHSVMSFCDKCYWPKRTTSASIAEETVRLLAQAQRPDITLDLKFGPLIIGNPIQMQFQAFNTGKTTAYNFGMHIACDWKDAGFDGVLDYGKPIPAASEPIRPGTAKYIHPQWLGYNLQPLEFIRLQNGSRWLLVYGVMWYEDETGRQYSELFCRRYDHGSPTDAVECPYSLREKMVAELTNNQTESKV